jgi:hypothetical protein
VLIPLSPFGPCAPLVQQHVPAIGQDPLIDGLPALSVCLVRHECCPLGQPEDENMRHTSLTLVGIAIAVISVSSASATMRITGDPGGLLIAYAERFEAARASGEPIVIDGACLSACTLVIGLLPRGQVCATPNAVLGFHAAWRRTANGGRVTSPIATQAMYDVYPANVRKWITRRGGLSERIMLLKGRELAAIVPACSPGLRGRATTRTVRRDLLPRAALAVQKMR